MEEPILTLGELIGLVMVVFILFVPALIEKGLKKYKQKTCKHHYIDPGFVFIRDAIHGYINTQEMEERIPCWEGKEVCEYCLDIRDIKKDDEV